LANNPDLLKIYKREASEDVLEIILAPGGGQATEFKVVE